jgi:hypothetical protein
VDRWPYRSGRVALVGGAGITVGTAVGFDILAGERPLHTAGLALVAMVIGVLRLKMEGRGRGLWALVSGAVVAQPALHAASQLLHGATETVHAGEHPVAADALITLAHVAITASVVLIAATGAHLLQFLATRTRVLVRQVLARPTSTRPTPRLRRAFSAPRTQARHRWHLGGPSRRGPPIPAPLIATRLA